MNEHIWSNLYVLCILKFDSKLCLLLASLIYPSMCSIPPMDEVYNINKKFNKYQNLNVFQSISWWVYLSFLILSVAHTFRVTNVNISIRFNAAASVNIWGTLYTGCNYALDMDVAVMERWTLGSMSDAGVLALADTSASFLDEASRPCYELIYTALNMRPWTNVTNARPAFPVYIYILYIIHYYT